MITRFLASRFAGPIVIALAALALAGGVYGFFQGRRADTAQTLADSRGETIRSLGDRIVSDAGLIKQRDILIASQNLGIENLAKAANAGRTIYLQDYARADERAKDDDARAAEIMDLTNNADELAQCRAARMLLEEELTQ